MSEITGPPAPAKTPQAVARSAERTQAARPYARGDERQQNQTNQQESQNKASVDKAAEVTHRDPAVSIAPTTAHLSVGERINGSVREVDGDGRPIVNTESAVLALRPDAGLKPGDDVDLRITNLERGIKATVESRNGAAVRPPTEVAVTVISLHKSNEIPINEQPLPVKSPQSYSPESLRQQIEVTSIPNQAATSAPQAATVVGEASANTASQTSQANAPPAQMVAGIVTMVMDSGALNNQAPHQISVEIHLPNRLPPNLPFNARTYAAQDITLAARNPANGEVATAVKVAIGTLYLPSPLGTNLSTGDPIMLLPTRFLQWPDRPALEQTTPVIPQLNSSVSGGLTSHTAFGGMNFPTSSLVLAQAQIQNTISASAVHSTAQSSHILPGLPLVSISHDDQGHITQGNAKPAALILVSAGQTAPTTATALTVNSAVPLTQFESNSLGLQAPTGYRAVRLTTTAGQFAALLPRGVDPTRERAFIGPLAGTTQNESQKTGQAFKAYRPPVPTGAIVEKNALSGQAPRASQPTRPPVNQTSTPAQAAQAAQVPLTSGATANIPFSEALPELLSAASSTSGIGATTAAMSLGSWPVLSTAFHTSLLGNPRIATALSDRTAAGGARLTNSLLFMLKALGAENPVNKWLGDATSKALMAAGKQNLLGQLRSELSRLFLAAGDDGGEWRPIFIPLDTAENAPLLTLLIKQDLGNHKNQEDQQQNEDDDDPTHHFLVEVTFSKLGQMQLEGRITETKFNIALRTHHSLGFKIEQDLQHLFDESLTANDFTGKLTFHKVDVFEIKAADYFPT